MTKTTNNQTPATPTDVDSVDNEDLIPSDVTNYVSLESFRTRVSHPVPLEIDYIDAQVLAHNSKEPRLAARIELLRRAEFEGADFAPVSSLIGWYFGLSRYGFDYFLPSVHIFHQPQWNPDSEGMIDDREISTHLEMIRNMRLHYSDVIRFFRVRPTLRARVWYTARLLFEQSTRWEPVGTREMLEFKYGSADILSVKWVDFVDDMLGLGGYTVTHPVLSGYTHDDIHQLKEKHSVFHLGDDFWV